MQARPEVPIPPHGCEGPRDESDEAPFYLTAREQGTASPFHASAESPDMVKFSMPRCRDQRSNVRPEFRLAGPCLAHRDQRQRVNP